MANLNTLGLDPIPGAAAAGVSARYEPEFEKLAGEIAKLESVEGRSSIRWKDVIELSTNLLSGKSKDLLVSSYLVLSLTQERGYGGLSTGLTVVRDMMKAHWEGLFPEKNRMRARATALQWMSERAGAVVEARPPAIKPDRDTVEKCVKLIEEIDGFSGEFGDSAPDLSMLKRAVSDKFNAIPVDPPPEEQQAAAAQAEAAPVEEAPPPPPPVDTPETAMAALAGMKEQRVKVATILREANTADPLAYRLLRTVVWEELQDVTLNPEGKLDLSGGEQGFEEQMDALLEKGDYAGVLKESEARVSAQPLWLDLNFMTARALEGLGKTHAAARKALENETSALLRRIPKLMDAKFADGLPLAGAAAQTWIQNELSPFAGRKGAAAGSDDVATEARKLLARKQFVDATKLMLQQLERLASRRDRFVCRLSLAKLCVEAGKPDLALPQLLALDEEGRKAGIEEWEPGLSAELVHELWKCLKTSPTPEKADEYYARLCRLNPGIALGANGVK
jgi:type VI secretion system protein VasJ